MKKVLLLLNILILYILFTTKTFAAQKNYFYEGKVLFDKNKFEDSKFFFEKDIVFNPKSKRSYLYLAKIYKSKENDLEQEMKLNNVLLLDPKNDEANYMLILLKIKQSDYKEAKKLIKKFDLICKSFCSKKSEIDEKFKKLIPENAKNNN